MIVNVYYKEEIDAIIAQNHIHFDSVKKAEKLIEEFVGQLRPLPKNKFLLIDLEHISFSNKVEVIKSFGQLVKQHISPLVVDILRFGAMDGMTQEIVQKLSGISNFPANIYADYDVAVYILKKLQSQNTMNA